MVKSLVAGWCGTLSLFKNSVRKSDDTYDIVKYEKRDWDKNKDKIEYFIYFINKKMEIKFINKKSEKWIECDIDGNIYYKLVTNPRRFEEEFKTIFNNI